jgi:hypothetical protein
LIDDADNIGGTVWYCIPSSFSSAFCLKKHTTLNNAMGAGFHHFFLPKSLSGNDGVGLG